MDVFIKSVFIAQHNLHKLERTNQNTDYIHTHKLQTYMQVTCYCLVAKSCLTPGSSIHGIFQARILQTNLHITGTRNIYVYTHSEKTNHEPLANSILAHAAAAAAKSLQSCLTL